MNQYIILNYRNPETNKMHHIRDTVLFSEGNSLLPKYIAEQMKTRTKTFTLFNDNKVHVLPESYTIKNNE